MVESFKQRKIRVNNRCPDCDVLISPYSARCHSCAQIGELNSAWYKTGRTYGHCGGNGYVIISGQFKHPNARKDGTMLEHVKVMSIMLGRSLVKGEEVHHKNGVRDDNRPENLELWSTSQPAGQRIEDKVVWATELLLLYKPEVLMLSSIDELKEYLTRV